MIYHVLVYINLKAKPKDKKEMRYNYSVFMSILLLTNIPGVSPRVGMRFEEKKVFSNAANEERFGRGNDLLFDYPVKSALLLYSSSSQLFKILFCEKNIKFVQMM